MTTHDPAQKPHDAKGASEARGEAGVADLLIEAQDLTPGYMGRAVMLPVRWCIRRYDVWALVGDNGSGKTSLLRTLLKLQPPCAGDVVYASQLVISYMAQVHSLDAAMPMRVCDYVLGGAERHLSFMRLGGLAQNRMRVRTLAAQLGFEHLLDFQLRVLSEGQKQRASLGRALMTWPDVLVLDEPTSAMDTASESSMLGSLEALADSHKMAIVVVGHHLQALFAATRLWAWTQGLDGPLVQGTRAEVAAHPGFSARFGAFVPEALRAQSGPVRSLT